MTRYELTEDMRKNCNGSFLYIKDILNYTGMKRERLMAILYHVPHIGKGKGAKFHVKDLSDALYPLMKLG